MAKSTSNDKSKKPDRSTAASERRYQQGLAAKADAEGRRRAEAAQNGGEEPPEDSGYPCSPSAWN